MAASTQSGDQPPQNIAMDVEATWFGDPVYDALAGMHHGYDGDIPPSIDADIELIGRSQQMPLSSDRLAASHPQSADTSTFSLPAHLYAGAGLERRGDHAVAWNELVASVPVFCHHL